MMCLDNAYTEPYSMSISKLNNKILFKDANKLLIHRVSFHYKTYNSKYNWYIIFNADIEASS